MRAWSGLTITIRNAPTMQPIKAPNIGISEAKAMRILISSEYGIRIMVITTKNIEPKIKASRHCPVKKLENVLLLSFAICSIFSCLLYTSRCV